MKNIKNKILIILVIFFFSTSCDKQDIYYSDNMYTSLKQDNNVILTKEEINAIVSSDEFKNYFNLRARFFSLVKNALNKGYSPELLTSLTLNSIYFEDNQPIYEKIFGSYQAGINYMNELIKTKEKLYNKFPALKNLKYKAHCQYDLNEEGIFHFYNTVYNNRTIASRAEPPVCGSKANQVRLVVCAGLCGLTTAGLGAALCGWACWCTFCNDNSAVADVICAD